MRYLIIVEKTKTGYSAYAPDLAGCVATGSTCEQVESAMKGAVQTHVEGMKAGGQELPRPAASYSTYLDVSA